MNHQHDWKTFDTPDMLMCDCDLTAKVSDVIHNTAVDAALTAQVSTISKLLFAGDLKKAAHEREYAWVMSQKGVTDPLKDNQGTLL